MFYSNFSAAMPPINPNLSINSFTVFCKIEDLESTLYEIENQNGFIKWVFDPIEQLDKALGSMADPDKEFIPPTLIYYMTRNE